MRFNKFVEIKSLDLDKIKEEALSEFNDLNETDNFDHDHSLFEADILKNVFGFMRLKSLKSKLIKAMADEGAADLDYQKKKRAGLEPKQREVLDAAYKQKVDNLKDVTSAIEDRIESVATTDYLKRLASKTKYEAKLAKAQILIKIASEQEAKELSLKVNKYKEAILNADKELQEWQKTNAAKIKEESAKELESVKKDVQKIDDKISDVNSQIDNLREDAETATKKVELLGQKLELTKKAVELKNKANVLHKLSDSEGDPPYDVESSAEELENLAKDVEQAKKSAEETSKEETSKEETPDSEEETEPTDDKESEVQPEADTEEVTKQKDLIASKKDEIEKLKQAIDDLNENPKKNRDKIDTVQAAIKGKENQLKKEEEKLASMTSKDNNSTDTSNLPKKFMKFEEYIAQKQITDK